MTDYTPLKLKKSQKIKRKPIRRSFPIPKEFIENRKDISLELIGKVQAVTDRLSNLTTDQKKAVFLKVEHGKGMSFVGTDMKPILEQGEDFSIVQVKNPSLTNLKKKLEDFGSSPIKKGRAKNDSLAFNLIAFEDADPFTRVSEELEEKISEVKTEEELLIFEIEISTDKRKGKQKSDLKDQRLKLESKFPNTLKILEHEDYFGLSRILVKSSKKTLIQMITDKDYFKQILWFDSCPTPQKTITEIIQDFNISKIEAIKPPHKDAPTVCVIDSGVTAGNPFLKPVISPKIQPKSYITTNSNPNDEANHGTGVAALAAYHSLKLDDGAINEPACWIASAKVLNAHNKLEEEKLFSKTLRKIVEDHKKEGIRIFNLSMVFENRIWHKDYIKKIKKTSWLARVIDNIARDEDVLFIICTGNIQLSALNNFISSHEDYPKYFRSGEYSLQDPANATYALTVGSINGSTHISGGANLIAICPTQYPSPFTRRGPGILRDIKPDVVEIGGTFLYDTNISKAIFHTSANVITASNLLTPALHQSRGTSFAAPRLSYKAAKILDELEKLGIKNPSVNLLKAFIINSTESVELSKNHLDIIQESKFRKEDLVGYGQVNSSLALYSDSTNVLMYLEEKIKLDQVLIVSIPIPVEVSKLSGKKRLKVTVVFSPEIQKSGLKKYHGTRVGWDIFKGDQTDEDIVELVSVPKMTPVDDEEEDDAPEALKGHKYGKNKRSKSCIQHDEYEWTQHKEEFSVHDYKLAIVTQDVWKNKQAELPISVVVHFFAENATNIDVDINTLIKNKIDVKVKRR